jgi:hypothetical protein
MKRFSHTMMLAALSACAVCACTHKAAEGAGGQMTQLSCGSTTYRVSAERVDGEVNDACERAKRSVEALRAYRATISRFTCQRSDGHVILSLLAPRELFDEYDKNCRQYLTAADAFHNRTMDLAAHQTASRDFTARNNALARKHSEDDNALFRQRQADQASLSTLIKSRGGSIEITN